MTGYDASQGTFVSGVTSALYQSGKALDGLLRGGGQVGEGQWRDRRRQQGRIRPEPELHESADRDAPVPLGEQIRAFHQKRTCRKPQPHKEVIEITLTDVA